MNKKRLIVGGFGLLSALGVASISLSLAWYTTGTRLLISSVNISFVGNKEIKIGVSETGVFKESLSDELNQIDNYYPVSSMFSSKWLDTKSGTPQFRNSYRSVNLDDKSTYQESTLATGGYFQQELYLYSEFNVWVTLDKDKTVFLPDEVKNQQKAPHYAEVQHISEQEALNQLNNVTKSLRFSLLNPDEEEYSYDIIDLYKENDTYLCGTLDNTQDGYYDNKEGKEIVYGEYDHEEEIIYDSPSPSDINPEGNINVFNAKHKAGVETFDPDQLIENKLGAHIENSIARDDIEETIEIPLKAQEPKKIVVSLYLEGWDRDNIDNTANGSFNASISFKIRREH